MKGNGRSGWIRTNDPLLPKQMRYQTAPHSDVRGLYPKHGGTEANARASSNPLDQRGFRHYLAIMLINIVVK